MSTNVTSQDRIKDWFIKWQFCAALGVTMVLLLCDIQWGHGQILAHAVQPVKKEVYAAIASIAGALLGFVITAFSIVASLSTSSVIQKLRQVGQERALISPFTQCILVLGLTTLISLIALIIDNSATNNHRALEYVVLGFFAWSNLSVLCIVFIIETMVRVAN